MARGLCFNFVHQVPLAGGGGLSSNFVHQVPLARGRWRGEGLSSNFVHQVHISATIYVIAFKFAQHVGHT